MEQKKKNKTKFPFVQKKKYNFFPVFVTIIFLFQEDTFITEIILSLKSI